MNRMKGPMRPPSMAQKRQAAAAYARMSPAQKRQVAMQRAMMARKMGMR